MAPGHTISLLFSSTYLLFDLSNERRHKTASEFFFTENGLVNLYSQFYKIDGVNKTKVGVEFGCLIRALSINIG